MKNFRLATESKKSSARTGVLTTAHGKIQTPFFMPIATRGAVKGISVDELHSLGAEIILSNTYHLLLRPGAQLLKKYGGLHRFMRWPGPILTDSGGFQVFSLSQHRQVSAAGVRFSDPQSGRKFFLTPESAMATQAAIGSDIQMVLDECPAYPCTRATAEKSLALTLDWARRSKQAFQGLQAKQRNKSLLFGIVQGSTFKSLREDSAKKTVALGFDGYAIGGVAVGEPRQYLDRVLGWAVPHLPKNQPRYLMGLGRPEELVKAVSQGIDMFDCVIPTREARHGRLYVWNPKVDFYAWLKTTRRTALFYQTIEIGKARYAEATKPLPQAGLAGYSLAYVHHLFRTNEMLGVRLATLNNLALYLGLMEKIRHAIKQHWL